MTDWSFDFDYNMPIERSDNAQMSVTNYDEEAQYKYHYQLKEMRQRRRLHLTVNCRSPIK